MLEGLGSRRPVSGFGCGQELGFLETLIRISFSPVIFQATGGCP